jgi:hypothetical protein
LEEPGLAFDHLGEVVSFRCGLEDGIGEGWPGSIVALRFKPCAAGGKFHQLHFDDGAFGPEGGAVQAQKDIAGRHPCPFGDKDRIDDAPIGVLHDLPALRDLDLAWRDDGTRQRREHGPGAKADDEDGQGQDTEGKRACR